jgi:hypothetical protein
MDDQSERHLAAEAEADSLGFLTDERVLRTVVIGAASNEIPLPWWAEEEDVSVPPRASVSELLGRAASGAPEL